MKYKVKVTETKTKTVTIESEYALEAIGEAKQAYESGRIILDETNDISPSFSIVGVEL